MRYVWFWLSMAAVNAASSCSLWFNGAHGLALVTAFMCGLSTGGFLSARDDYINERDAAAREGGER